MTPSIPLLFAFNLFFIFLSRFHSLSLRRNRLLVWFPCLGSIACLVGILWNLETEPSVFILLVALLACSALFSTWSIAGLGMLERTQERIQRSVEFVSLQTFFLSLAMVLPRIETYAIAWLGTSWLWGLWKSSRRNSTAFLGSTHATSLAVPVRHLSWSRWIHPLSDCLFFLGLYLFYASGNLAGGEWMPPVLVTPHLTYGVLLIWFASLTRMTLVPLSYLVDDSRSLFEGEDVPYTFMQTVGFAFPAVLILLDPIMGVTVPTFEALKPSMKVATHGTAIFTAVASLICVLSAKKSRVGIAAFALRAWTFWLTCTPDTALDWLMVQAFQNFLGLALAWIVLFHLEFLGSAMAPLRWMEKGLFLWIIGGWAMLSPGAPLLFQQARAVTLDFARNPGTSIVFYLCLTSLALIAGRLMGTAYLWSNPDQQERSLRLWILEAGAVLCGFIYLSLDITVAASIGASANAATLSIATIALFGGPFLIPFFMGTMSAKWLPPPPPFFGTPMKTISESQTPSLWSLVGRRMGLLVWYSPVLVVRSSSRAMASASTSVLWVVLVLTAAVVLLKRGML